MFPRLTFGHLLSKTFGWKIDSVEEKGSSKKIDILSYSDKKSGAARAPFIMMAAEDGGLGDQ